MTITDTTPATDQGGEPFFGQPPIVLHEVDAAGTHYLGLLLDSEDEEHSAVLFVPAGHALYVVPGATPETPQFRLVPRN